MCRRKKVAVLSTVAGLFFALFVILPATNTPASAQYGDGGKAGYASPYVDMIDWVDWSQATDPSMLEATGTSPKRYGQLNWKRGDAGTIRSKSIKQKPYEVKSRTNIGNATVVTTCSLSHFYEDADAGLAPDSSWINIHIPGSNQADGWDKVYHEFNEAGRRGLPVGIGRKTGRSRFDVDCHAELERVNYQTRQKELVGIPIRGLVFADAETLEREEEITIIPAKVDADKPAPWRMLEAHKSSGRNLRSYVSAGNVSQISTRGDLHQYSHLKDRLDENNVLRLEGSYQPQFSSAFRPFATMYAENANGAYIDVYSPFSSTFIAMGVVIGADIGDGPASYGQAGAIVQPRVEGQLVSGVDNEFSSLSTASIGSGPAPFLGTTGPDMDSPYTRGINGQSKKQWDRLIGDDDTNSMSFSESLNDEDAIKEPLLVTAQPGKVERSIDCEPAQTGATTVSGWLDWNANERFEESERANAICVPKNGSGELLGSAKLIWNVSPDMLPSQGGSSIRPSLLRLIATTESKESFGSDSFVVNGEVEDHAVTLVQANLSLVKRIVGTDGTESLKSDRGGFKFTVTGNGVETEKPTQETTADGSVKWPFTFSEFGKQSQILGVFGDQASPQSDSNVVANVKVVEQAKTEYLPFRVSTCTAPSKPEWIYQNSNSQMKQVYAWPTNENQDVQLKDNGFVAKLTPTTVLSCQFDNQPYGQISLTPLIDSAKLDSETTIDKNLVFSGTYTCIAPQTGPFAGNEKVSGQWGPVATGQTWTSDPNKEHIYAGSTCSIEQTDRNEEPILADNRYTWDPDIDYKVNGSQANTVVAYAGNAGETIDNMEVINKVERSKTASLSWTNVDSEGRALAGATFKLVSLGNPKQVIDSIVDCTKEPCTSADKDPNPGSYKLPAVVLGNNYQLEQTQPPAGFVKITEIFKFDIKPADIASGKRLDPIPNYRIMPPQLPMSGGISAVLFQIGGLAVIFIAIIIAFFIRGRKSVS
ncbi:CshA/CshB family fibrillar adhesin-related protein [Arcanobacterium phocae]|uniref:CshA/CshB family fibrillar adhesin-related protein n=1 Tax=Arcanobacterium phocae TaxID=131112 RepID=UPI001C125E47|nr:CshA/CshB family fibrillar adhesin-related protein [Arcanobacterium phocae]